MVDRHFWLSFVFVVLITLIEAERRVHTKLETRQGASCASYSVVDESSHDCGLAGTRSVVLDQCNPERLDATENNKKYFWILSSPVPSSPLEAHLRLMCEDASCAKCRFSDPVPLLNGSSSSSGPHFTSGCLPLHGAKLQIHSIDVGTCDTVVSTTTWVAASGPVGAVVVEVPLNVAIESPLGGAPAHFQSRLLDPPPIPTPVPETEVPTEVANTTAAAPPAGEGEGDRDVEDLPPSSNDKPQNRPYAIVIATVIVALVAIAGYAAHYQYQRRKITQGKGFAHLGGAGGGGDGAIPDNFGGGGLSPPISPTGGGRSNGAPVAGGGGGGGGPAILQPTRPKGKLHDA